MHKIATRTRSGNFHKMTKKDNEKFEFDQILKGRTETETITRDKGTTYSMPGYAFLPGTDTDQYTREADTGNIITDTNGISFYLPINLPDGATITSVAVYGNAGAGGETWFLLRKTIGSDGSQTDTMATESITQEDTSISNATISNREYHYYIETTTLDTNDTIYGIKIRYKYK